MWDRIRTGLRKIAGYRKDDLSAHHIRAKRSEGYYINGESIMISNKLFYLLPFVLLSLIFSAFITGCNNTDPAEQDNNENAAFIAQVIKHTDKLYDVSVAGAGNVWVVGYFGVIFHSTDNGLNWIKIDAGTKMTLLGVSFVNDKTGWIVGDQGTILHTVDGGQKWERQKSPVTNEKLLKVQFINEREGWIVGTFGLVLHTEDGGINWERLPFTEDVILNDLCFINPNQGWIAGEYGLVLYTEDGGKTWVKQLEDEMGRKMFGIAFIDPLHGIVVGNEGVIYTTRNGGKDWELKSTENGDTLLKVAFADDTHATAVGLRGCLTATGDGGDNWRSVCPLNHFTWLSGIACDKKGKCFAVGDGGKFLTSNDSGRSWAPYNEPAQK